MTKKKFWNKTNNIILKEKILITDSSIFANLLNISFINNTSALKLRLSPPKNFHQSLTY